MIEARHDIHLDMLIWLSELSLSGWFVKYHRFVIIKLFEMLDDNHVYFVSKSLLTNQTNQTKPLSKPISQPAPSPSFSYQPPATVDYLRFLYVSSSSVKTPLSSQVGNIVLIDAVNVLSRVLSIVFFLRASCCFPDEKKTRSIPPPDAWQRM